MEIITSANGFVEAVPSTNFTDEVITPARHT